MDELRNSLFKKYGVVFSDKELIGFLDWFIKNESILTTEEIANVEIHKYIANKYKGRRRHLFEQDNSSLKYLLMLLKKEANKNKKK